MSWSETTKMRERMRFVVDAEGELFTMTELCERYGISRMMGHKWLGRFRQDGLGALEDRCRAPLRCPHRTDPEVVEALVEARSIRFQNQGNRFFQVGPSFFQSGTLGVGTRKLLHEGDEALRNLAVTLTSTTENILLQRSYPAESACAWLLMGPPSLSRLA
jgi:hypothetical protein